MEKILYFNNCWFTNVGEAFIDIGAMELIHKIFPQCQLINISDMNMWYFDLISKREKIPNPYNGMKPAFHMFDFYSGDFFILAGMFVSDIFLKGETSQKILALARQGKKIIFLGLGAGTYSNEEMENFKKYVIKINPVLVMSRDNIIYENLKDIVPAINGIDCAFWVKDVYDPREAFVRKYDVVTYNRSPEPEQMKQMENIVRTWHMNWKFNSKNFKKNMFISDTPYDYLTIYANADRIYTDLVHATIAGLQYERKVKFERVDNRGFAIDVLGADIDDEGFLYISESALEKKKRKIENEIIATVS